MQADILSLRGAIWRHSRLQILRKPILAFIFPFVDLGKRNWKGLESALQFQPCGIGLRSPNCALFPQGPIFPYRPVGACGNNWVVPPDRHANRKPPNQRVRRPLFPFFAGGFALWRCRSSIRRYSAAPKREFRSQLPLPPLSN